MFRAFKQSFKPYGARKTQYTGNRCLVKRTDLEMISLAKSAIVAAGGTIADVVTQAYAQALSKYRAKLESEGKWESVLAEHNEKRAKRVSKDPQNPRTTRPESRPPQVFEG